MGLTICKKIVENMGGKIDCYSAGKDQGCTFMFTMRMNTSSEPLEIVEENPTIEMVHDSSHAEAKPSFTIFNKTIEESLASQSMRSNVSQTSSNAKSQYYEEAYNDSVCALNFNSAIDEEAIEYKISARQYNNCKNKGPEDTLFQPMDNCPNIVVKEGKEIQARL